MQSQLNPPIKINTNMGLAVLPPEPDEEDIAVEIYAHEEGSDASMQDDDDAPPSKRRRLTSSSRQIALPGEVITDDTQWMRYLPDCKYEAAVEC